MSTVSKPTDLTAGPIAPALIRLALPLLFGNILQQLYNTVDAVIVGRFAGGAAFACHLSSVVLRAVGNTRPPCFSWPCPWGSTWCWTWGWRPGCPWGWRGLRWPQGWAGSESSPSGPLWSGKKFTNMKAAGADLHGQRPFSIEKSSSKSKSITIRLAWGILKPSCQKPRAA